MGNDRGILMHISSLPSEYGIGNLGKEARNFVDFLKTAGMTWWQILPQNPTGYGDSPYQSVSAFAGNPYFLDIDAFVKEGLLEQTEVDNYFFGDDPERVDYGKLFFYRFPLLRCAFFRFEPGKEYEKFVSENAFWLDEYALFMALKELNHYKSWLEWDEPVKNREEEALKSCEHKLKPVIDFYKFIQFKFYEQWFELKEYANKNGIKIIGDMPIYVASDSADVWAERDFFMLDENCNPKCVACLPESDIFKNGQIWGNPIYNWDKMEQDGFKWWIKRFEFAKSMYDLIRVDHFCGFFKYYSVERWADTVKGASEHQGLGLKLFDRVKDIPDIGIIAENLGVDSPEAESAIEKYGFLGMNILEFSVDYKNKTRKFPRMDAAYTGNHDTDTLLGWYKGLGENKKRIVRKIFGIGKNDDPVRVLIDSVLKSDAPIKIIPIQDYLGYGSEHRMNIPSTVGGNWLFRIKKDVLCEELAEYIRSF